MVTGVPKPIARAIRQNKTLVLLFTNGKSADDKAVQKALKHVDRWDGRVYVGTAPIKKIAKYGRIARGVDVEQSPTIVVADRDLRADTLVGYVDSLTIDQAVVDARRNTTGIFTDPYLRKVDAVCVHHSNRWTAIPHYWIHSGKMLDPRLSRVDREWAAFTADFKAVKAPKKWSAFHTAAVADLKSQGAKIHTVSAAVTPKSTLAAQVAAFGSFDKTWSPAAKRDNHRIDGKGLFRCGSQL